MIIDGREFFLLKNDNAYFWLDRINRGVFYIANAIGLFVIIYMLFRIRHVADETLIKRECLIIVGVWILFSIQVFGTFVGDTLAVCIDGWSVLEAIQYTY